MPEYRKVGVFYIKFDMLCGENISKVLDIMQHCIILEASKNYNESRYEYLAYSPLFSDVEIWELVPHYRWRADKDNNLVVEPMYLGDHELG